MNPEDILKVLDELGKRLEPIGVKGYEVVTRQVMIEGISQIILSVLAISMLYFGVTRSFASLTAPRPATQGEDDILLGKFLGWGFVGFLGTIGAIWIVGNFTSMLTKVFNPEWAAIEKILSLLPQ
jgi:hypothetical protein